MTTAAAGSTASIWRPASSNASIERQARCRSGPNDLVFDAQGGFYFSDLGKVRAREMDRGAVYYAKADGSFITEVRVPDDHAEWCGPFTQ